MVALISHVSRIHLVLELCQRSLKCMITVIIKIRFHSSVG